ncbi:MAG: NADH-quinone oxidoreductase subunit N [Bacteroidia bacterium]|nr:NADH-quinone oxidoreductase subunit N [Bacteroidia bacterium]
MNTLITVSLLGIAAMLSEVFRFKKFIQTVFIAAVTGATGLAVLDWGTSYSYFRFMVLFDDYALAFSILFLVLTLIWLLLSQEYFCNENTRADYFALISFSLAGAIILSSFSDLSMFFIGIEILSVSAYVLAGSNRSDIRSAEAALKYFLPGAFSTGFLLFGMALIYGATGSFNLSNISQWIIANHSNLPVMVNAGVVFLITGLLFKIAAMPFHNWAPDVYDGSPTPVTAYMSTIIKAASFAAFYRLFVSCFSIMADWWTPLLVIAAAITMIGGNITAVYQNNLKRMLAYSSIAHSGYLLLAVAAINQLSKPAMLFYLAAYSVASLGMFTLVNRMGNEQQLDKLKGFAHDNPFYAALITLLTLSMAGIPPLAGFFGKYYVFLSSIRSDLIWPVIVAVIASLIGVYYYFRIVYNMYSKPAASAHVVSLSGFDKSAILITALLTLLLGIAPALIADII